MSCAAAKNRKKVLHLDQNDFYGESHATFSLKSFIDHVKELKSLNTLETDIGDVEYIHQTKSDIPLSSKRVTNLYVAEFCNYIEEELECTSNSSASTGISAWKNRHHTAHPSCTGYVMETERKTSDVKTFQSEVLHPIFFSYIKERNIVTPKKMIQKDRHFNIEMTSKVFLGAGSFVEYLLSSGT